MELWTREHAITLLPALGVMIVIALVLRHILSGKDDKVRMIPFHVISVIMVALEIFKQAESLRRGYDLYHLPFHFCSLFVFVLPFMSLYRGKYAQTVRPIAASLCTSVFLMMIVYPNLIYSARNIDTFFSDPFSFHTVLFHNLVVLAFLLFPALDICKLSKKKDRKALLIFTICFCVVSATMAQLLQTNYNNFYSCNIPPLEAIRLSMQDKLGYGLTQGLYVAIVTVLDILFVQLSYGLFRLIPTIFSGRKLTVK